MHKNGICSVPQNMQVIDVISGQKAVPGGTASRGLCGNLDARS